MHVCHLGWSDLRLGRAHASDLLDFFAILTRSVSDGDDVIVLTHF